MRKCIICKKKEVYGNGSFFTVPKEENRRRIWSEICGIELSAKSCMCEDHFSPLHMIKGGQRKHLLPNAEPYPYYTLVGSRIEECPSTTEMETFNMGYPADYHEMDLWNDEGNKFNEMETQTEPIILECTMLMEIQKLRKANKILSEENAKLTKELNEKSEELENIEKYLQPIFTKNQIKKLQNPRRCNWKKEDIESSLRLYTAGREAYHHLYNKGYPIPHETTLFRWSKKQGSEDGNLTKELAEMEEITVAKGKECDDATVSEPETKSKTDIDKCGLKPKIQEIINNENDTQGKDIKVEPDTEEINLYDANECDDIEEYIQKSVVSTRKQSTDINEIKVKEEDNEYTSEEIKIETTDLMQQFMEMDQIRVAEENIYGTTGCELKFEKS
ncbi:uncharacterized protein [Musca autumnalis]|uniref:uncharacterized protein n=1 Tax=Musca autumnalis TaxID=221902 RepID=UPI003CF6FE68